MNKKEQKGCLPFVRSTPSVLFLLAVANGIYGGFGTVDGRLNLATTLFMLVTIIIGQHWSATIGWAMVGAACVAYGFIGKYTPLADLHDTIFFWIWIPLTYGIGTNLYQRIERLRRELEFERKNSEQRSFIDSSSGLRNLRAFQNDAMIYMKIAKRYHLCLGVTLWHLTNACELKTVLTPAAYEQMLREVSHVLHSCVRSEDMSFLLDDSPDRLTWGTMYIANDTQVCENVIQRLSIIFQQYEPGGYSLKFKTSHCLVDREFDLSPTALIERAMQGT